MELGEKIYYLRKKNALTFEQIGQYVGVSRSTVQKWEADIISNMKIDKISKLAKILNTTPAYLMGWEDDPQEKTIDGQIMALVVSLDDEQKKIVLEVAKQLTKI